MSLIKKEKKMTVIQRSKMPDGTDIQIEDWKKDYDFIKTLFISAYPIARESNDFMIKRNNKFRLELSSFKSDNEVLELFNKLENGIISLKACIKHFDNKEDAIYL